MLWKRNKMYLKAFTSKFYVPVDQFKYTYIHVPHNVIKLGTTSTKKNIATGETSQAITPFHFFDNFNFFNFHH